MCASTPNVSCTFQWWREGSASHRIRACASRSDCHVVVRWNSPRPASPLLQLDHSPESALDIAAHLLEQPDIPLEDGLLDPGDLQADLRVEFGWAWVPSPVGEHRPGQVQLRPGPGDGNDFDPAPALPERLPELAVRRAPGAERRRGLVARIDVHEHSTFGVQCDRQPESDFQA